MKYRDERIAQTLAATKPTIAPRDVDATIEATAVIGARYISPRMSFEQYGRTAMMNATTIGMKMQSWMPNSPEFWNQPGAPPTPSMSNANPRPAHDRKPCWVILRLQRM